MKKIAYTKHREILKELSGKNENIVLCDYNDKICVGFYIDSKDRKIHSPLLNEFNIQLNNVIRYVVYVKEDLYFMPVRADDTIVEYEELKDYYLAILRREDDAYFLELFHNNDMVFSKKLEQPFAKFGVDIKIIYTTRENEKYCHWVYREGQHRLLYQSDEMYFSKSQYEIDKAHSEKASILNGDFIELIFHHKNCKRFYIAEFFAKNHGDKFEILPRQFDDDDTYNYKVLFQRDRIEDISFMAYCIETEIRGYAVYGFEIDEIKKGCLRSDSERSLWLEMSMLWEHIDYENQCREILKHIYEKSGIEENLYEIPQLPYFDRGIEQAHALSEYLQEYKEKTGGTNWDDYKKRYNEIYDELVAQGIVEPKWKSEYDLYKIAKSLYPDAIYQYRVAWLGFQSLDIFIPSIGLGIEYQGIQHYKAVNLFGGDEGFEHRKGLDKKKRELCDKNNVRLLYWRYDEKISKVLFEKRIKEI